jgi:hypothetical protein
LREYRNLVCLKKAQNLLTSGDLAKAQDLLRPIETRVFRFKRDLLLALTHLPAPLYRTYRRLRRWA